MLALKLTRIDERGENLIQLDFKTKNNGLPVLGRGDIDDIAERVIHDYKSELISKLSPKVLRKNPRGSEHFMKKMGVYCCSRTI